MEVIDLAQSARLLQYTTIVHDQLEAQDVENVTWKERVTAYQDSSRWA